MFLDFDFDLHFYILKITFYSPNKKCMVLSLQLNLRTVNIRFQNNYKRINN